MLHDVGATCMERVRRNKKADDTHVATGQDCKNLAFGKYDDGIARPESYQSMDRNQKDKAVIKRKRICVTKHE